MRPEATKKAPKRSVAYLDKFVSTTLSHALLMGAKAAHPHHALYALMNQTHGYAVMADTGRIPEHVMVTLTQEMEARYSHIRSSDMDPELDPVLSDAFDKVREFLITDLAHDLSPNIEIEVLDQVLNVLSFVSHQDEVLRVALFGEDRQIAQQVGAKTPEEDIDDLISSITEPLADRPSRPVMFAPKPDIHIGRDGLRHSGAASPAPPVAKSTGGAVDQNKSAAAAPDKAAKASPKGQLAQDAATVDLAVKQSFRSITDEVAEGKIDPVIGRDKEIRRIVKALQRRRKRSVILGGPAGVGKTALAEGVAIALRRHDAPATLAGKTVYELSMSTLISGARYRGDFEERMTKALDRIKEEKAIVFIDEIHTIMGLGNTVTRGMDAPNILKPALARGEILLIGATTTEEMAAIFEDRALSRRLDLIEIDEPGREEMIDILTRTAWIYGAHQNVDVDTSIFGELVDICAEQLLETCFPDKAFDVVDRACVEAAEQGDNMLNITHIRTAAEQLGACFARPPSSLQRARAARLTDIALKSPLVDEDAAALEPSLQRAILLPASYVGATLWVLSGSKDACAAGVDLLAKSLGMPVCPITSETMKTAAASYFLAQGRAGEGGVFLKEIEGGRAKLFYFDEGDAFHESAVQSLISLATKPVIQSNTGRRYRTRGMHIVVTARPDMKAAMGFGGQALRDVSPNLHPLIQASGVCAQILQDIPSGDAFDDIFYDQYLFMCKSGYHLPSQTELYDLVRSSVEADSGMAERSSLRDRIVLKMMKSAGC